MWLFFLQALGTSPCPASSHHRKIKELLSWMLLSATSAHPAISSLWPDYHSFVSEARRVRLARIQQAISLPWQKAAGVVAPWAEIITSLIASILLENASLSMGRSCALCGGSDHDKSS